MSKAPHRAQNAARSRRTPADRHVRELIAPLPGEDYFTYDWMLLFATWIVMAAIFFLFTPYTHQLDEIKNMLLMSLPPFLFAAAIYGKDFRTFRWRTHASTILLGLLVVEMLISWVINPIPRGTHGLGDAIAKWIGDPIRMTSERVVWFQLACMTFTVVFAWYMDSEAKLRKTMLFYVVMSLASVLIGLFLFAGRGFTDAIYNAMKGSHFWSPQTKNLVLTLASSKEMYSTILNSDFFAAYLVMTIPIPLSMFFVEDRVWMRGLAAATFLLMNVCLVFTNSNDSYMAMVFVAYPLYFLLAFRHFRKVNISRQLIVTFLAGSAVLFITVFVLMIPTLSQTWDFKTAALDGRKVLWSGGFWPWLYRDNLTKSHVDILSILFGTGPGGYRFYFPVFRRPDFFDNQINNVTTFGHNYYLDYLLEFGLIGLALFLAFYGRVLYDAVVQSRRSKREVICYYQIAMVAGLCGIAVQNFFSPNNRWAVCGMVFWSLFGLSMGIRNIEAQEEVDNTAPAPARAATWAKWGAYVLAALFLVRSVPQGVDHFQSAMEHGLALTYMELADYREDDKTRYLEEAKNHFLASIKYNPTFASSYYKLGHVLNQLGDVEGATKIYEDLNRVFPHYSEVHLNLGIMYSVKAMDLQGVAKLDMLEKSYAEIKEAARQELKPNVQWLAGTIGRQLVEFYESLDTPNTPPDLKAEAQKRNPGGKRVAEILEEIKTYYRNIITYEPKLEEYRIERKKYYERAERELVALAFQTGKLDEAEQLLKRLYNEDPSKVEYLAQLLALYDKQGKQKEKIQYLEGLVHSAPTDVALRQILAEAYQEANDMHNYVAELRRIETLDPKNKFALTHLLTAYHKLGDKAKLAEYPQKLRAIGEDPDAILAAADLRQTTTLEGQGDLDEALLKTEEGKSSTSQTPRAALAPTTASAATSATTPTSTAKPPAMLDEEFRAMQQTAPANGAATTSPSAGEKSTSAQAPVPRHTPSPAAGSTTAGGAATTATKGEGSSSSPQRGLARSDAAMTTMAGNWVPPSQERQHILDQVIQAGSRTTSPR
jgi:tetratricopeptide (TPR) repeat protein